MTDLHMNPPAGANAPPPNAVLMQRLFGGLMQKCIGVAAKLGIADLLWEKPQTAAELAEKTGTHAPSLHRVLRTLASTGIFSETADHRFELTPLAALLRSDAPNSMRDYAIMINDDCFWQAFGALMYSVETGGVAHEKVQGMSSFEFFARNEEAGQVFNRGMTSLSRPVIPAVVGAYDFSGVSRLVDVAGNHGVFLAGILKANPHLQGVLVDLPHVIAGAGELLEREGVSGRVELVTGDFFESVPAGGDAYMMKSILHDWDDERSVQILRNIRSAMRENGKLLIVEMVVPEGNEPSPSKPIDLIMLVMEGGKERTADEFGELLEAAGFRLTRLIPTRSPYSIIEGERA